MQEHPRGPAVGAAPPGRAAEAAPPEAPRAGAGGRGWAHAFTVFTPTHDRAHTLPRVHAALRAQTFRDFEWLIVDDGSTDGTAALVRGWAAASPFPIRHVWQPHRGKHVAFNRAVAEARGELFLVLDSDDACVPEALARFMHHWLAIPAAERERFSAVTALCVDQHGALVGTPFPRDVLDSDPLELRYRHRVRGEKWGFQRTDVLRRFPFPAPAERTYLPEGLLWNRIGRHYRTRFVNERLRIYWIEGASLVHGAAPARNALGGHLQHRAVLDEERDYFRAAPLAFLRSAVHYARFSFHLGLGLRAQAGRLASGPARALWGLALPLGWLVYRRDRWRDRRRAGATAPAPTASPAGRPATPGETGGPEVLFVIGDLTAVGGAETHLLRILPGLARRGIRPLVYVLAPASTPPAAVAGGVEVIGPPLAAALAGRPRTLRRTLLLPLTTLRLVQLLRRRRPAVVHFFLPEAYLVGGLCALAAGQRVCVVSRRSLNRYQRAHPLLARLERRLHRRMAAVLGNSRAVVAELRAEGVPPARLGLLYSGIAAGPPVGPDARVASRARLGLAPEALLLLTVANLIPYKGHADLLDALAPIAGQLPPGWRLLCAGRDDGSGAALRARARDQGLESHVLWLGERRDVADLLAAADLGILASHEEGFSNSVLEALAAGVPMIVTAVGGNPEAVEHAVSGLVVPPRDPAALGAAILALARDPGRRRQLGEAGRARVLAHFSLDACVARYARLYTALAAGRPGPVEALLEPGPPP